MALLPLAGWSVALKTLTAPSSIAYGATQTVLVYDAADQIVPGANFTIAYYTDEACTVAVSGTDTKTFNVGNYWLKVTGDGVTYTGSLKQALTITPRPLTVHFGVDGDFTIDFLGVANTKPAIPTVFTTTETAATSGKIFVDGIQNDEAVDDILTFDGAQATYSYAGEPTTATDRVLLDAVADKEGNLLNPANTGYAIDFANSTIALKTTGTGAKGGNYTLLIAPRYMRVKQIPLLVSQFATAAELNKFTVTRDANYDPTNNPLYNGTVQNIDYTVAYKYGAAAAAVYTLKASDFEIWYKSTAPLTNEAIDALAYTPVIKFGAEGNFYGADIDLSAATGYDNTKLGYEIEKNTVYLMLNPKSKTFDGYKFLDANSTEAATGFNFSGLLGRDLGKSVTGLGDSDVALNTTGTLSRDAGTYNMIVKETSIDGDVLIHYPAVYYTAEEAAEYNTTNSLTPDDADYKTTESVKIADPTKPLNANYNVIRIAADWVINKKAVTVTATHAPITYGTTPSAFVMSSEGGLQIDLNEDGDYEDEGEVDEAATIEASYKATTAAATALTIGDNDINVSKKEAKDYADYNSSTKTSATYTANEAVLKNYTITPEKGTLKVNGVGFTILPNIASTMEYGTTPAPTYAAFNNSTHTAITVKKTPTYLYRKSTEAATAATTTVPTAVGTYIVSIKDDEGLAPTGYDPILTVYQETPFEITKKVLDFTITPDPVILHDGDTKTILNHYAKVTLKEGYTLVGNDKILPEFDFVAVSGLTIGDEADDFVITAPAGDYANAIVASLPADVANNNNYELKTGVKGNLNIAATRALFVDGADPNVNYLIQDAATACANDEAIKYGVAFADRTLTANEWNVMVLPFAITPLEFCNAKCTVAAGPDAGDYVNDYAIFNVLKSANKEANTMKFGITLNEIPANTPFLVKPTKDIKFMRTYVENPTTTHKYYLTFTGRTIEYAAVPKVTVDEVDFIGTFKNGLAVEGGESIMFMGVGADGHYTFLTAMDGGQPYDITVNSTRAYLDFSASGMTRPTILVEEADGSTTAITNISVDGVAMNAEGWYTLNGVKLQSMPTQKGVYINNGKKVVIK